jgi:excinuclease ABC subunit C
MPKRACLNYHLKQCPAPCINRADKETYLQVVKDVILFLEGNRKQLLRHLNQRMMNYAANQEFEKAVFVRDQIKALISLDVPRRERQQALEELKRLLGLRDIPRRVEAFDISNYAGKEAVGSLVSFADGVPRKVNYRRFKIKFVEKIDDYAMMREVVRRRFGHLIEEKRERPDLMIIDGGRGHLAVISKLLEEMGFADMQVAAIAKENEQLYILNKQEPIDLFKFPKVLFLIQRIRDEAHRFAISYHHKLRLGQMRVSVLDQIPGVGEKRKRILLRAFGSVGKIREATFSQLNKLPAIDEKLARRIIEYLKR